nr:MAG TPA: hypothetical protein [Crassvirales sp.]DAT29244.1 MAG TPA: hypothetical protein [Caudoviricetes sp.]
MARVSPSSGSPREEFDSFTVYLYLGFIAFFIPSIGMYSFKNTKSSELSINFYVISAILSN